MKKLILTLSIVAIGFTGLAATASAQRYQEEAVIEGRFEGPRISIGRGDDPRWQRGGRGRAAVASDLNRLNREVRIVREEIREAGGGGRRVRAMFHDVYRGTERLNAQFDRGTRSPWEIRHRIEELRDLLDEVRRELRYRGVRRGGDWR